MQHVDALLPLHRGEQLLKQCLELAQTVSRHSDTRYKFLCLSLTLAFPQILKGSFCVFDQCNHFQSLLFLVALLSLTQSWFLLGLRGCFWLQMDNRFLGAS